jgi:WD40 repeat protein
MLPDGHQAITGHLDGTIRVWDLRTGHAVRTIAAHTAPVSCLAVTGDGRHCISGSNDKTLKIFELVSRRKIAEATVETHHVKHFDLSTDGRRLLSGGGEYFSESSESWKGDGD